MSEGEGDRATPVNNVTTGQQRVIPPHLNCHPYYLDFLFKDGLGPYPIHHPDPSFGFCLRHFGQYEYGLMAVTTAVPAYIGYKCMNTFRSFHFIFGVVAGGIAGLCYAYAHSYARLAGFKPYNA